MTEPFTIRKYLRDLPLPFCKGCGCLTVMNCFLRALHELDYHDMQKFVFCSGIGCAAWIPSPYFRADSIHAAHGRSIPVATGIKLMRPDLNVIVFGGDGDIAGIGLSHLVHAARRNIGITVVMVNNMIYGMTGGQVAPTTPLGIKTTTTPYGSFDPPLDTTRLVATAGASYAARWTTLHFEQLKDAMKTAVTTNGFAFIEAVSPCPTTFGRRIGLKDAAEMLRWFKQNTTLKEKASEMTETELASKIVVGKFAHAKKRTFTDHLQETLKKAEKAARKN